MVRNSPEMRKRSNRYFQVVGRLRSNQSVENAQAELKTIAGHLETEYQKTNRGWTVQLMPLRETYLMSQGLLSLSCSAR